MFPRDQRQREGSEKLRTTLPYAQSREQHLMDRTLNTTSATTHHSSPGQPALFFSDPDHDIFPQSSTMFSTDSHLATSAINIDDNTNEFVGPSRVHQFLHQNPPWVPHSLTTGSSLGNEVSFTRHDGPSVYHGANHYFPTEIREAPASAPEIHTNLVPTHYSFPAYPPHRLSQSVVSTADNAETFYEDHSMTDDVIDSTTFQGMSLDPNGIPGLANDSYSNFGSDIDLLPQPPLNADLPATSLMAGGSRKVEDRITKRRQFYCDVPGCDRTRGFQSDSDLDRHKRGRHNILSSRRPNKAWRCQACLPGKNGSTPKLWDRLDNFRNHCRTAHKNENPKDLIQRSEVTANELSIGQFAEQQSPGLLMNLSPFQQVKAEIKHQENATTHSPMKEDEVQSQSSRGRTVPRGGRAKAPLPSDNGWDPFATVTPRSLSVHGQPIDNIASALEETSSPLSLSTSPFLNSRTLGTSNGKEAISNAGVAGPVGTQESTTYHSFSTAALERFETDLLQSLIETLRLDSSATERARRLLASGLQQLTQSATVNANEGQEESPDSSHLSVTGSISTTTSQRALGKYRCDKEDCKSAFDRQCELTKHEKRHLRPWICIWPECQGKSFGSKADWKRHEGSRHLTREVFKCSLETINKRKCPREFPRGDQYQIHLKKDHEISDEAVLKAKTENDRRIKDLPDEYWCGFCRRMEPYNGSPEEAWNRRIDHIEKHFQEKLTNTDWFPETSLVNGQGFLGAAGGSSNSTSDPVFAIPNRQGINRKRKGKRPRAEQDDDDDDVVSAVSSISRSRSIRKQ